MTDEIYHTDEDTSLSAALAELSADGVEISSDAVLAVIGDDVHALRTLATTEETPVPVLDVPFEEYTVSETLLLLIAFLAFILLLIRIIKGGFSWLR